MNNLYGDIIEVDEHRCPVYPDVVVAYRSGKKIGILRNVDALVNSNHMMEAPELSFDVHKKLNGVECELWGDVKDFRLIYVPVLDAPDFNPWYELHVTVDEYDETVKHCECFHIQETELSQLSLHNIEINTESDIDRDDYVPTKIYDETNSEASLLNRLLKDKASHYSIHHVDGSIANLQRTFSWSDTDIKSAFDDIAEEVECLFVYGLSALDDGKIHRTISVYDLNDVCLDCGERGSFEDGICTKCGSTNIRDGYGLDSGIFINAENFASEITYESNADDVKNCFRLEGGDDVMTDAIRNINPTRSQYIWYLNDDIRSDMSEELQSALSLYDTRYKAYESTEELQISQEDIDAYNTLVNKYSSFDEDLETVTYPITGYSNLTDFYYKNMELHSLLQTTLAPSMPDGTSTTAAIEAEKLSSGVLSSMGIQNAEIASETTVNSAIINYAKVYFESALYGIKIKTSSYNSSTHIWTGILTLTSYTDEEDTADTTTIATTVTGATAEYLKTLLEKTMKKNGKDATGTVALFELTESQFETALSSYSLDNLSMFSQIARACLDVLIDQGCATEGSSLYADTYNAIYLPYYRKSGLIEIELAEREAEVATVDGILEDIEKERTRIATVLDLKSFLGNDLWAEFCSFRRDGEYKNENYISDGLDDKEIITNSQEFMKRAQRDLIKASTLQHTISCNLNDFILYDARDYSVREEIKTLLVSNSGENIVTADDEDIIVYVPPSERVYINNHAYVINKKSAFAPLLTYFKIGNWIRVEIDDNIYKLRMTDYTVTYDDLAVIEVEFSDVTYALGAMSDISSILSKSASMSTSYSTVSRQAGNGQKANSEIVNMIENGLYLTNKKIVNADNQNFTLDEYGMLVRQIGEYTNDYLPEQVKIINRGLYFTNDDWLTAKAAIGKFEYYDPMDGIYKEGYGVIAEKIIGNLILGNDLGIYNESGSFTANEDGVIITAYPNLDNSNLFTVRRSNGDGTYTTYMDFNANGDFELNVDKGSINLGNGNFVVTSNGVMTAKSGTFYGSLSLGGSTSPGSLKVYDSSDRLIAAIDKSNFYIQSYSGNNTSKLDLLSGAVQLFSNDVYHGGVHNRVTSGSEGIALAGVHTLSLSTGTYSTGLNAYYMMADSTAMSNLSRCPYVHNFYGSMGSVFGSVSLKSSNNGISADTGLGYGVADINKYNVGMFEVDALTNGTTRSAIWVFNRNTSGSQVSSGAFGLIADKSGNITYTVAQPANLRSAISAVNKGGDTMTGSLTISYSGASYFTKHTGINAKATNNGVSSTQWWGLWNQDNNAYNIGAFLAFAQSDGKTGAGIWVYNRNTSGTQIGSCALQMFYDKSGNVSYSVSTPRAFFRAVGTWIQIASTSGTTKATFNISGYNEVLIVAWYSTTYAGSVVVPTAEMNGTEYEWYLGGGRSGTSGTSMAGRRACCKLTNTYITPVQIAVDGVGYNGSWRVYAR